MELHLPISFWVGSLFSAMYTSEECVHPSICRSTNQCLWCGLESPELAVGSRAGQRLGVILPTPPCPPSRLLPLQTLLRLITWETTPRFPCLLFNPAGGWEDSRPTLCSSVSLPSCLFTLSSSSLDFPVRESCQQEGIPLLACWFSRYPSSEDGNAWGHVESGDEGV